MLSRFWIGGPFGRAGFRRKGFHMLPVPCVPAGSALVRKKVHAQPRNPTHASIGRPSAEQSPGFYPDLRGNSSSVHARDVRGRGVGSTISADFQAAFVVLPDRIELSTSPLPR